jgi:intracellular sulfur oxidation DsrE/DsrF family protein
MNTKQTNRINEFLNSIDTIDNLDLPYFLSEPITSGDLTSFDDVLNYLEDQGAFNVDIIYYSNAIKYLQEHDSSLRISLDLAEEFGFSIGNLSSETLASLLASQNVREEFTELESDFDEFFEELEQLSDNDNDNQ